MSWPNVEAAITSAAAPRAVRVAVDRLLEVDPAFVARMEEEAGVRDALVAVVGASRSLTELCLADDAARSVLVDLDRRPAIDDDVARWKRLELLRVAARDLTGLDDLPTVGRDLARLADDVLREACAAVHADDLAVVAMGKLGGEELNYSSDIDVVFVGGADAALARAVLDVARTCYRVDVDLRPEGRDGPLVRSLESFETYWGRWAQTWEFQALLKARAVAGDEALGTTFVARAHERLWNRPFTSEDLRAVRAMKARSEQVLARKGLTDREVKRGRGGIRDIEFSVQLLQLVHGARDPGLRSPTTLEALDELASAGYVDAGDARSLDHAYRLLRTVEHRLQLVHEQQVHVLPKDPAAQERLARVMGYRDSATATAGEMLAEYLGRQQATVRSIHEHLFFRPLLDALTAVDTTTSAMSPDAVATRLHAFGFSDAARTRQALHELTRGLTRRSRLMQQMLPLLLGWLSESPDPDLGLLRLRVLTAGSQQATELAIAFRESPEVARRLCLLVGTSRRLGEILEHHPDVIPSLGHADELRPRRPAALTDAAVGTLAWRRGDSEERQTSLLRFKRREELLVAARDVLGLAGSSPGGPTEDGPSSDDDVVRTGAHLTSLAESCLTAALGAVASPVPLSVVAMGRFGGGELSYASDLDLLFVHGGTTGAEAAAAERAVEAVTRFLAGSTPATRLYTVDLGLRPEGKDGPLARSLESYRAYYARWAETWERQALIRARPVAGDTQIGHELLHLIEPFVWRELADDDVRAIRRMKARIERERIPTGEDAQFHLKLGRGSLSDVEFCIQLLQLRAGVRGTSTMGALASLQAAGVLSPADAAILSDAYRFCERTRNRWFLIKGTAADSLPSRAEHLSRLAHSLGSEPATLREDYRRVTRRCRSVVERLFYGKVNES